MIGTDLHFSVSEMGDQDESIFTCWKNHCPFRSTKFDRVLNHVWDKHSIEKNFSYKCGISGCLTNFTKLQSFRRNYKRSMIGFSVKYAVFQR